MKEWNTHMNEEVFALDRLILYSKVIILFTAHSKLRLFIYTYHCQDQNKHSYSHGTWKHMER